jgi:hypothetical protein
MKASKIFWTKSERTQLNKALVEAFTGDLNLTRREALTRAQLTLPLERRRKMTDQVAFHEREVVEAARNAARTVVHSKPEPVTAPEPVESINPLLKIFDELLDMLADRIVERLRPQVTMAEVKQHIDIQFDAAYKGNAAQRERLLNSKPSNPRKPTALIIGLNGCQMSSVSEKYPDVKFTFMTAEEALGRNKANADHTVLMTKFINHSVQNKYRKVPNLHYCNGGVSDLSTLMHVIQKPI